MLKKRLTIGIIALCGAIGGGVGGTLIAGASGAATAGPTAADGRSRLPTNWYNTKGQLNPQDIPDRVAVGTALVPGGTGWVSSVDIIPDMPGAPAGDGPYPVYSTETGGTVVALYYKSRFVVPLNSTTPAGPQVPATSVPPMSPSTTSAPNSSGGA